MQYFITFLEGILTFISPCILPMLPIYLAYLTGSAAKGGKTAIINAVGFVVGFSIIFITLGAVAGSFGSFVSKHNDILNIIGGLIIILFGLNFAEIIKIPILNCTKQFDKDVQITGFFSSALFGAIFSIGWTPCVGAFLGAALMQAASSKNTLNGVLLLVCYCGGLGVPFILSAIFINQLKGLFEFIKKHYDVICKASGVFLVIMGILLATGLLNYAYSLLGFI